MDYDEPETVTTWINRADILLLQMEYRESLEAIEKALLIEPKNSEIWFKKKGLF